ncbi:beta strand repeat-containing protein [Pararcticibacter amylolyticus]|uniref:Peptidase S74 domain-containing protein n=1 Tax=Pararcticibacter amylolyticus TaxID=2173175 RepID=A0A2U2PDL9_9SPHI|nr:hypothetical protein [Pararcticibacter amylolyticus]PWG79404.1 hypothetical protein DDR33_16675 [Pararcticibacter amylolyticus]
MDRRFICLILIAVFFSLQTRAQVGIGTTTPDASAQLEVYSISKGLLIPRLSSAQRGSIASPATGLLVYQTDNTPGFYFYNAGEWKRLASSTETGAGNGSSGNSLLNGSSNPATGVGNNGDFYINTSTYTLYGPKANGAWPATGAAMLGASNVSMGGFKLTNLAAPTNNKDAANKKYVDDLVASSITKFEPTLSLDNEQNLSIKGGNSVSLADLYQSLSLAGTVLSISGPRNSHVDLSGILALANGGNGVPGIVYHDETLVGTGQTSSKLSVNDQGITAVKLKSITSHGSAGQILSSDGLGGFKWTDQGGLSPIASGTILGNNSGADATPVALSIGDLKAMLALSAGDVGLGNVKNVDQTNAANLSSGYIPAARFQTGSIPASAIAGNNLSDYYLSGKGTWVQLPVSTDDQSAAEVPFDNSLAPGLGNTVQDAITGLNSKIGTVPAGALTQVTLGTGSMLQGKGTAADPLRLADITGPSFLGRASGTGTPAPIGIGSGLVFGSDSKLSVDFSGLASSTHNHALDGLSNVITGGKSVNDILQWNGTSWVNVPASVAGGGFSGVTTDGSTISGDGKTTPLYLVNKAVSFSKLADMTGPSLIGKAGSGSGTPEKIGIGNGLAISGTTLGLNSGSATGDILQWDGSQWLSRSLAAAGIPTGSGSVTFSPSNTGDVTAPSVSGSALTPVLSIRDGVIGTNKLIDGTVTTAKLADGAVTSAKLATGAVDLSGTKVTGTLPSGSLPADLGTGKNINGLTLTNTGTGITIKDASNGTTLLTAAAGSSVSGSNTGDQNASGVGLTSPVAGKNNVQEALEAINTGADQAISFQTTGGDVATAAPVSSRTSLTPTLTLNNDAVTSAKIKDGAVTAAKLAAGAVDLSGTAVTGTLPASNVSLSTPVLSKTNVQDALTALESQAGSSISGVSAGSGLSGGGTTGNITLSLASNGVGASNLKGMGNTALGAGTSGYVLQSNGDGTFGWFNLSGGVSADPSTLTLSQGQFYVGNSSNKAEATAKNLIPLSGFGTPTTDIGLGSFKLTNLGAPSSASDAATKKYVDDQVAAVSPSLALDGLSNVTITSKATNDLIQWNGTKWVNKKITDAIPVATTSVAGLLSGTDKTKLDGLSSYILPAATSTTLGGVIVESGSGLNLSAGKLSVNSSALTGVVNSMVAGDGISVSGATGNVTVGVADNGITTAKILNGGVTLSKIETIAAHTLLGNSTGSSASPQAITLGSGLAFSGTSLALDPSTLPVASASTSGTVKIGNGLKMTSGVLSVDASTTSGFVTGISGPEITVTPNSPGAGNSYVSLNDGSITLAKLKSLSGTSKLVGSSSSGSSVSEITIGSGLSLSGSVLTATGGGGSGTVTTVGVATANGFAGDVANATSTPQITLKTTVNGILQGNGTGISAATTTGTGSVVLATNPTITGATISGSLSGNASTATSATTATNATNTAITAAGTSGTVYPTFVSATTGNLPQQVTSALTYNLATQELNAKIQPSNITNYPASGSVYLAGDGTWKAASADLSGLKLSYTASSGVIGLTNGGSAISGSSQTIPAVTSSNPGLMASSDFTKLTNYLPATSTAGLVLTSTTSGATWQAASGGSSITGIGYNYTSANDQYNAYISLGGTSYKAAVPVLTDANVTTDPGLLVKTDKVKLMRIPTISASSSGIGQVLVSGAGGTTSAWQTPALSYTAAPASGGIKLSLGSADYSVTVPQAIASTTITGTDGTAGLLNANDKFKLNNTLPAPSTAGLVLTSKADGSAEWKTSSGGGSGSDGRRVYFINSKKVLVKGSGTAITCTQTGSNINIVIPSDAIVDYIRIKTDYNTVGSDVLTVSVTDNSSLVNTDKFTDMMPPMVDVLGLMTATTDPNPYLRPTQVADPIIKECSNGKIVIEIANLTWNEPAGYYVILNY